MAYYPGTEERLSALQRAEPAPLRCSAATRDGCSWPARTGPAGHYGFGPEFFAPAMVTTSLPGEAGQFLQRAVDFCNDKLYGTLSVNLIVHPTTRRQLGADFDRAIAALQYGGIGINTWSAAAFLVPRLLGSLPGSQLHRCAVRHRSRANALMFDKPLKTVVSAPFRPFPRSIRHGENTLFPSRGS